VNKINTWYGATYIIVERGMFGYYVGIADDCGPLGRIEDWNYATYEEAANEALKVAEYENMRFLK
jgi:hypothetical protein